MTTETVCGTTTQNATLMLSSRLFEIKFQYSLRYLVKRNCHVLPDKQTTTSIGGGKPDNRTFSHLCYKRKIVSCSCNTSFFIRIPLRDLFGLR